MDAVEATAVAHLPDARLLDQVGRPGECGSGRRGEVLVERDVDRVEEGGDLVEAPLVERAALPQPRAVEMEGGACARALAQMATRSSQAGSNPPSSRSGSSSSTAATGSVQLVEVGGR